MTYDEAVEAEVSREEALAEVRAHGCDMGEFVAELGWRETYGGAEVLAWLGY